MGLYIGAVPVVKGYQACDNITNSLVMLLNASWNTHSESDKIYNYKVKLTALDSGRKNLINDWIVDGYKFLHCSTSTMKIKNMMIKVCNYYSYFNKIILKSKIKKIRHEVRN